MKIGILTHHYINNFGAFLQAYALQQALRELFPEDSVCIVNCINVKHFLINTAGWFRFYRGRETLKMWLEKTRLPHIFSEARKDCLALTKLCFSAKQVNDLGLDCIIVGSDEVWNYGDPKGRAKIKFGEGLSCKNLTAYAPSVGNTSAEGDVPEYVAEGIKKFSALSARDDRTAELIKNVSGREAVRVLDPTFLVPCPTEEPKRAQKPYILFYYCEKLPAEIRERIFKYADEHGLRVYGAGECDKRYSGVTAGLTPFEWTGMFKNAEYVFTGTFHGAVFSILNKKQFKVYLTNESRIKKVNSLLSELGINDRTLLAGEAPFGGEPIDYEKVGGVIAGKP